ncbi:unnamed protein product [Cuscuta campestris]|uniref:Uncharacterized protein n=1 Tax=Cuscuta campestris TaxID=132261 RepID=A0A484L6Y2_9ASTE|nr:unnamed protein product [Cuscuta campestris]
MEELKRQVDKDGSFGPTVEIISPFTARVMKAQLPRGKKAPEIRYKGVTDPNDHLAAYQTHMLMHAVEDEIQCRLFVGTLEGPAVKWFLTLPNGTIDCFKDLAQLFLNAYGGRFQPKKHFTHLFSLKQKEGETNSELVQRWNEAINEVEPMDDKTSIALFMNVLRFTFRATNNEAEYEALIGGIQIALFMKIKHIRLKSDSKLAIGQLKGEMEAKEGRLKRYRDCARTLLGQFESYELIYVPREENEEADMLAKLCRTIPIHMEGMVRQHERICPVWEEAIPVLEISGPGTTWMSPLIQYLEKGELPIDPKEARRVQLMAPKYQLDGEKLYKRTLGGPMLKCLSEREARRILEEVHQGVCSAHQGALTLARKVILQGFYWPTLKKDALELVRKCPTCQAFAPIPGRPSTFYTPVTTAIPFARWGLDLVGPFAQGAGRKKFAIVAIDYFTKTIVDGIKKRLHELGTSWVEELSYVLWAHRTTPRRATGETPFALAYGFEAKVPTEVLVPSTRVEAYTPSLNEQLMEVDSHFTQERRDDAAMKAEEYQRQSKRYHDKKAVVRTFEVGDWVLRKREKSQPTKGGKLAQNWEGPYRVEKVVRTGTYQLATSEGKALDNYWNVEHLKKFYQ